MDLHAPLHNGQVLVHALRRHRDRPVVAMNERTLTGQEVADEISRYVQAFAAADAGPERPGALLAPNRPEVLFILGAGQTQGARRTALHPLGSLDDHAFILDDAAVEVLVVDPTFSERAAALIERVDGLRTVLTIGPTPPDLADTARSRGIEAYDLVAAAATYDETELIAPDLPADHVVAVTYTGGTTGRPKGVVGTARQMATMTQIQLADWEWPDQPRFLLCTPLSHAGAAFFLPTMVTGGTLHVASRFDPGEVLAIMERERISATMLVPSMLYALLDHPDSHTRDLSSLETVYYGAAAINPTRLAEAIERFGPIFAQFFGQSEAPMAISYLAKGAHDAARLTSCGRPSVFIRHALLDDNGAPVRPGEPGEICVAGPLVAAGYLDRPEETAATFRDGWLHTGDVAREDADGFWHIVDRTKDMIVTGGFNIYPREVEDAIANHPAVAQVAVIGTPDDRWGEAVTALVVLRRSGGLNQDTANSIRELVKQKKGSVHVPKRIEALDSIPLTALGKPDKKALRARWS